MAEVIETETDSLTELSEALEEIGKLIDRIECSNKDNLALLPLLLKQQKRAAAALNRMEQPQVAVRLLELAREERNLDGATLSRAAEYLRALKQQP